MSDVVSMTDYKPHIAGPVLCLRCGHYHISVRPNGVNEVECHKCHAVRAVPIRDALLAVSKHILGGECCGDKDQDGVCCAPACSAGTAARTIQFIIEALDPTNDR